MLFFNFDFNMFFCGVSLGLKMLEDNVVVIILGGSLMELFYKYDFIVIFV